jgi:PadR family transcriptional regulator
MDHRSQLLKGVLDMCLLAIINEEPSYGYEMADKLSSKGLHLMSEGSIYPTLSRMQRSALIEGFFVEVDGSGPPRKYYRIAPEGEQRLAEWKEEWIDLRDGVDEVVKGART